MAWGLISWASRGAYLRDFTLVAGLNANNFCVAGIKLLLILCVVFSVYSLFRSRSKQNAEIVVTNTNTQQAELAMKQQVKQQEQAQQQENRRQIEELNTQYAPHGRISEDLSECMINCVGQGVGCREGCSFTHKYQSKDNRERVCAIQEDSEECVSSRKIGKILGY